jgi:hypothetical protein
VSSIRRRWSTRTLQKPANGAAQFAGSIGTLESKSEKGKEARKTMTANLQGVELLRNPSLNEATAYTEAEKQSLGLVGLVPDVAENIDTQLSRVLWQLQQKTSDLESDLFAAA